MYLSVDIAPAIKCSSFVEDQTDRPIPRLFGFKLFGVLVRQRGPLRSHSKLCAYHFDLIPRQSSPLPTPAFVKALPSPSLVLVPAVVCSAIICNPFAITIAPYTTLLISRVLVNLRTRPRMLHTIPFHPISELTCRIPPTLHSIVVT